MLRYKTETRPGLVALYDIRPGNRAGQFLQPRSLHGASLSLFYFHITDYQFPYRQSLPMTTIWNCPTKLTMTHSSG